MEEKKKRILDKVRRVVVKVGSAVVAGKVFDALAENVSALKGRGMEVVLVSSGAVAKGMERLALNVRPVSIPEVQAIAALGQTALMAAYDEAFANFGFKAAQVLLTHDDLGDRRRFLNARNTLFTLLKFGVVPVINENDTVAVDEIKFGDNDRLSALVTNLVEADVLVMLTDVDSIMGKEAERIDFIEDIDNFTLEPLAGAKAPAFLMGTGGIVSKLDSARKAAHFGAAVVIANGLSGAGALKRIFDGEDIGTFILPKEDRLTSKKHWITYSARATGRVIVDEGARDALSRSGRSLLPSGVVGVDGAFAAGEVIHCVDHEGMEFARGVVNYSSNEIMKIKGLKSVEIEKTLGYRVFDEVIHRDNLVIL